MKRIKELKKNIQVNITAQGEDGCKGFVLLTNNQRANFIASWGLGWDHVSISIEGNNAKPLHTPHWHEMCEIKDIFFNNDECVVQYHPAKKDYISIHPNVLHLWRPHHEVIPMPPKAMI